MEKTIIKTKSAEETRNFGKEFAKKLPKGSVIALFGDLGSGKTTLVQGIAEGLGITKRIVSPSFPILRVYTVSDDTNTPIQRFYHIDLYRIENQKEIRNLGMEEILSDENAVTVIEWAEKMEDLSPTYTIRYTETMDDQRTLEIT